MEKSTAAEKIRLRGEMRARAAALPEAERRAAGEAMAGVVLALPAWQRAKTVFMYVSVWAEPDTRALMAAALQSGKRLCVPRCEGGGHMQAVPIADVKTDLFPAPSGLLEPPPEAPAVPPEALDLVLVPCVAADKSGLRLGNGGGYYDRYLLRTRCPTVCLCYGALLLEKVPREAFDIPVDLVLTEDGLYP